MARPVEIKWVDSCSRGMPWTDRDDLANLSPAVIRSVGFVVAESDDSVTLAAHLSPHQVAGVMCIPRVAITSRRKL